MRITSDYDVILDFHNTLCPDNDCSFIGASANPLLLQLAAFLNLRRVIIADYDCINKYLPNCLSIEISLDSSRMSIAYWRTLLAKLAAAKHLSDPPRIKLYRYVATLTSQDRDKFQLESAGLGAFKPLPPDIASRLGQTGTIYAIFLGPKLHCRHLRWSHCQGFSK